MLKKKVKKARPKVSKATKVAKTKAIVKTAKAKVKEQPKEKIVRVAKGQHSFRPASDKPFVLPKLLHFKGDGWAEIGHVEPTFPEAEVQKAWSKYEYNKALSESLNWYSLTQDDKIACPLALNALTLANDRQDVVDLLKKNKVDLNRTASWIVRMAQLGFVLRFNEKRYIAKHIRKALIHVVGRLKEADTDETPAKPNIQDRIDARIKFTFGALEAQFSDFLANDCSMPNINMQILMDPSTGPPGNRYRDLIKKAENSLSELKLANAGRDEDLVEAYAPYGKRSLKKMVEWWETLIDDINSFGIAKKNNRKSRKRKSVSPDKVVSKLKYLKTFPELQLNSIDSTLILRSNVLWVYNIKTRKLGLYVADKRSSSLDVKGTKILNVDPVACVQKTLRKPEKQLAAFAALGKPAALKWFEGIRSMEIKLKPALSKDCVLLKAFK